MTRKLKLAHVGVHDMANDNAGDTLLFHAVRWLFESTFGEISWELIPVWRFLDEPFIEALNRRTDGIIVGGGGLFLRDQEGADTSRSGWQWNIELNALEKIDVPLIVFGVGYNRFRNQRDFDPVFRDHLKILLEKSSFFGLRNSGSIQAISQYVPRELQYRIQFQPCPTTVLRRLISTDKAEEKTRNNFVALNPAYDRLMLRFPQGVELGLSQLAGTAEIIVNHGFELQVVAHKAIDEDFFQVLEDRKIPFSPITLSGKSPLDIIEYYSSVSFVVGMRGHAQMIPLGLHKPIYSLITHDKMRFLLDDLNLNEWGCELDDPNFKSKIENHLNQVKFNYSSLRSSSAKASNCLYETTCRNMGQIRRILVGSQYHA